MMDRQYIIDFLYKENGFQEFANDVQLASNLETINDEQLNFITLLFAAWRVGRLKSKAELLGSAFDNLGMKGIEIANDQLAKAIDANRERVINNKSLLKRLIGW